MHGPFTDCLLLAAKLFFPILSRTVRIYPYPVAAFTVTNGGSVYDLRHERLQIGVGWLYY